MNNIIQEQYTKDGKELTELIQEWINENNNLLNRILNKKGVKSNCK